MKKHSISVRPHNLIIQIVQENSKIEALVERLEPCYTFIVDIGGG